jgi:hypothetical protein
MALELRNRFEGLFARTFSATLLWNYPTIDALTAFLANDQESQSSGTPVDVDQSSIADVDALSISLGEFAEMSDDDVARALRGNR